MRLSVFFNILLAGCLAGESRVKKKVTHTEDHDSVRQLLLSLALFCLKFFTAWFTLCLFVESQAYFFANCFMILSGYLVFPHQRIRRKAAKIYPKCMSFVALLFALKSLATGSPSSNDGILFIGFFFVTCRKPFLSVDEHERVHRMFSTSIPIHSIVVFVIFGGMGIVPLELMLAMLTFSIRYFSLVCEDYESILPQNDSPNPEICSVSETVTLARNKIYPVVDVENGFEQTRFPPNFSFTT